MFKSANLWHFLLLMNFLSLELVPKVKSASLRLNECEQTNYSPCRCAENEKGILITCEGVDPEEVRTVFNRTKSNADLHILYMSPSKTAASYEIPADVLNGRRTDYIQIECLSAQANVELQVDADAFRSTSTKTGAFDIRNCDLYRMDFNFLRGFNRLKEFSIESCTNIQQSIRTLPLLPALEQLEIVASRGLPGSSFRNLEEVGLQTLRLENNGDLKDDLVQTILKSLTARSIVSLRSLHIADNLLTIVPPEVARFNYLSSIDLENNKLTQLLNGQFRFYVPVDRLNLGHNLISSIAPEAFQGDFRSARVSLANNKLTLFEQSVFKVMLQQMSNSNGKLYIDANLFTCDCHLAWLIRDNSNLLKAVEGGACSNGTAFNQLNPDGYNDCDSVRTSSISMESIDESSTIKPQIFSPKPPEMIKDETSETFESTTTIMASATPMATSDISNKTIATTTEISSTIEKIFATTHGAESSNLTTLLHATTVSSFTEIPEVITRDESTIPVQSGTQTSALETTTVTSSTQITRRDVTENLVGSTIETTTQIINQQKTAHTESPFTMEAEITSGTPDVSHSQMGKDTTPIPTLMDRVNTTNTSTIHEILATEENSTTLTKGNTTEVSLLNHTTERTELPSISEGTSSTMITPLTSSPLPLPSQAANVSILGRPVNSNSPLGEGLEPRTDMAEFLTNKSNIQAASELSGATEMPISFTTRLSQDNSETTIQLSETSWANNEDLTTTTKSSITNVTNLTTFESNSKTITSTTLNSSPSPTAATSNYNLTSATVAPPTAAEMNVTNIASSTSFTMTTANPTKNPANSTSHVINASVNVTYTAPSESVGHSSPTILRASGEIVKTVSSASSILPFNYLALAAVAVVNLMHH